MYSTNIERRQEAGIGLLSKCPFPPPSIFISFAFYFCCFSFFHGSVQFSITVVAIGALRLCFPVLHLHHMGWSIEELAPHVTSAQQLLYAGDIQHSVGYCLIIRSQTDPKTCTTKRSCFVFPLLRPTGAFSTLKVLIKLTLLLVLVCVVVDTQGGPAYGVGAETIFHNRKMAFLTFCWAQ